MCTCVTCRVMESAYCRSVFHKVEILVGLIFLCTADFCPQRQVIINVSLLKSILIMHSLTEIIVWINRTFSVFRFGVVANFSDTFVIYNPSIAACKRGVTDILPIWVFLHFFLWCPFYNCAKHPMSFIYVYMKAIIYRQMGF